MRRSALRRPFLVVEEVGGDGYSAYDVSIMHSEQPSAKYSKSDHAINILKAAVSAVPIVGGPIASLMGDYIPRELEKRSDAFVLVFAKKVERLSDKVDENLLESPQFITIFLHCYRSVLAIHNAELVSVYHSILLGVLVEGVADEDELSFMLRITDLMTPLHIKILNLIRDPEGYLLDNSIVTQALKGEIGPYSLLGLCFPEYDEQLLSAVLDDMKGMGLHRGFTDNPTWVAGGKVISPSLTEFGVRYSSFITRDLADDK